CETHWSLFLPQLVQQILKSLVCLQAVEAWIRVDENSETLRGLFHSPLQIVDRLFRLIKTGVTGRHDHPMFLATPGSLQFQLLPPISLLTAIIKGLLQGIELCIDLRRVSAALDFGLSS